MQLDEGRLRHVIPLCWRQRQLKPPSRQTDEGLVRAIFKGISGAKLTSSSLSSLDPEQTFEAQFRLPETSQLAIANVVWLAITPTKGESRFISIYLKRVTLCRLG